MQRTFDAALLAGAALVSMLVTPAGSVAQSGLLVAAGAGIATDTRGIQSGVVSVAPTFTAAPGPDGWFSVGATVARFSEGSSAVGGNIGLGGRRSLFGAAPLSAVLAGAGSFTRASYGASFGQIEVVPSLELSRGVVLASVGVRAAAATSSVPGVTATPFTAGTSADTSRSALSALLVAGLRRVPLEHGALLDAIYREERGSVSGAAIVDRSIGLSVTGRATIVGAAAGYRDATGESVPFGSVGITIGAASPVALQLAAGRYASNRLTGVPGGRFASAGVLVRFGIPKSGEARAPAPSDVDAPAPGRTRVAIRAPKARQVEVAGDWNGWRAVPARRAANGVWYADLALAPGRYRYAFRVDGSTWTVPEGATAEDDGVGGKSAWLTVRRA